MGSKKLKPLIIPQDREFILGTGIWKWKMELKDGTLEPQMYFLGLNKIK